MDVITIKHHATTRNPHTEAAAADPYGGSPDADFMRKCNEVDRNPPRTWDRYDLSTPAGAKKVVEMEYRELMSATTQEETTENIYHLSVALLRLWRAQHDTDKHAGTD